METLLEHLVKSAALMGLFFVAYHLLLRKETFFISNRWYLLAGLVTSVVLPAVTYTKIVWVDPLPVEYQWQNVPMQSVPIAEPAELNWTLIVYFIYGLGALFFLMKFALDFFALRRIFSGRTATQRSGFKFLDVPENVSPFSFMNYIVYNSSLYTTVELQNILEHEKVHCRQKHTIDVLVARIFCIIFWWNPLVWLYKKAMLQNLEFIADSEASRMITDKKLYQITLLKITTHDHCVAITNHFYQSLIKKRIVMLNKNQSKSTNYWKYAVIIPALAAFILCFQIKVVAQEKTIMLEDGSTVSASSRQIIEMTWTKNSSDEEFKTDAALMKKSGVDFKFSNIKRNSQGEITAIKLSYKDKQGNQQTKKISGTKPIEPIHFTRNVDMNGNGMIGFVSADETSGVYGKFVKDFSAAFETPNPVAAPDVPAVPSMHMTTPDGEHVIVTTDTDEKGNTKVMINGEVVSDIDVSKILADMDPIIIDEIDVLKTGKDAGGATITINTREITANAMRMANEAMATANSEMERSRKEMAGTKKMSKTDLEQSKRDLEQSRLDIEQAKRDLEQARLDIEQSRRDLEQSRRDLEQSKRELQEAKK